MKRVVLVVAMLAFGGPAVAGSYSYMQQCNNFQCGNKENFVCPTTKDLKRYKWGKPGACTEYDAPISDRKFTVLQQSGPNCRIVDGQYVGWTKCEFIQFDTSKPLR